MTSHKERIFLSAPAFPEARGLARANLHEVTNLSHKLIKATLQHKHVEPGEPHSPTASFKLHGAYTPNRIAALRHKMQHMDGRKYPLLPL